MRKIFNLSAAMLLFFLLSGLCAYSVWGLSWFGIFMLFLIALLIIENIRHWDSLSEDIILLAQCESPHRCEWLGSAMMAGSVMILLLVDIGIGIYQIIATIF